jgi:acetyltransferase-like isoleucine patch superfamily enzyme
MQVCIFGFDDSLAGYISSHPFFRKNYQLISILSICEIPEIDTEAQHQRNPVKTTSYIENGRIFGVDAIGGRAAIDHLKEIGEKACNSQKEIGVFLADTNQYRRERIFSICSGIKGVKILKWIDPNSSISEGAIIGEGSIIFPNCHIGYKTEIGKSVLMQSRCTIEHHNHIDDFANINPGLLTGGNTYIGKRTEIHIGVTAINRIFIGHDCRIGAGSLVLNNCESEHLHYGTPCKKIRKNTIYN